LEARNNTTWRFDSTHEWTNKPRKSSLAGSRPVQNPQAQVGLLFPSMIRFHVALLTFIVSLFPYKLIWFLNHIGAVVGSTAY
jgi:hypothetical protein